MSVYKDEQRGTWYCMFRYNDWTGRQKQKCKRGFKTKREAKEYEEQFIQTTEADMNMKVGAFVETYFRDKQGEFGNGTMNVMQIIDNKPLEKSLVTDKFGVGICMKEIQKELSKESGEDIPEMLIEPLLRKGLQGRTDNIAKKVEYIAKKYTENIRKRLTDYGYKEELVHLYVIGRGGCLLQNYSDLGEKAGVTFITDICANAKGYEILAEKKLRR